MILDKQQMFEDALAVSGLSVATTASTNVIDLGVNRDIGIDMRPILWIAIGSAFTSGGAGTLEWTLQSSADNSTYYTILRSPATMALADLTAGNILANLRTTIRSPTQRRQGLSVRYLRLQWVVGTAVFTGGTLNAGLVLDAQDNLQYPDAIA